MQDPTRAGAFWPGEQYEKIYRYCYFRLGSRERAEDATQEAFCRWLEHGGAQQDPLTALKYLYTVARNLCADEARRPRTVPLAAPTGAEGELPEPLPPGAPPEEEWTRQLAVRAALGRLDAAEQELLLLRYVNELPLAALAGLYGVSRFAVGRRLHTAAAHFRRELQKEGFS